MTKSTIQKRLGSGLLVLCMALALFAGLGLAVPLPVHAAAGDSIFEPIVHDMANGSLTLADGKFYRATGNSTGNNTIELASGTATVLLDNVTLDVSTTGILSPISVSTGATLTLILRGSSTLQGDTNGAGLSVPAGATLNIYTEPGGSLTANGGLWGAGIGGGNNGAGGTVNVYGGTVNAYSSTRGAGIGGGRNGAGGSYSQYGGVVTAIGGDGLYDNSGSGQTQGGGAGIGGGGAGIGGGAGQIAVFGGTLAAMGGAGIGGGSLASGGGAGIGGGGAGIGGGDGAGIGGALVASDIYIESGITITATGGAGGGDGAYTGGKGANIGDGGGCAGGSTLMGISPSETTPAGNPQRPTGSALTAVWLNGLPMTPDVDDPSLLILKLPTGHGINLSQMLVSYTTSPGATVTLNNASSISGITEQDFSNSWQMPLQCSVTAADGSGSSTYTLQVGTQYPYTTSFPSYTGQAGGITATIDADYATKFYDSGALLTGAGVWVDGTQMTEGTHYTHASSSTAITLLPAYLDTLANGTYNIEVRFVDGMAEAATFTVAKAVPPTPTPTPTTPEPTPDPGPGSPQTGDNSNLPLWATLGTLALAGLALCGIAARKRFGRKAS